MFFLKYNYIKIIKKTYKNQFIIFFSNKKYFKK